MRVELGGWLEERRVLKEDISRDAEMQEGKERTGKTEIPRSRAPPRRV